MDLCGLCVGSSLVGRLPLIGVSLAAKGGRRYGGNSTSYWAQLTFDPPLSGLGSLNLSFGREGLLSRVTNWLRSEIQVGDPLFDDNVTIRTRSDGRDLVRRLLESEGLQSAVLSVVSGMDGDGNALKLQDGEVSLVCTRRVPYSAEEWQQILLELVALAIHLRRSGQDDRILQLTQETRLIQDGLDESSPEPLLSSLSEPLASARLDGERIDD